VFGDTIENGYLEYNMNQLNQIPNNNKIIFDNEINFIRELFFSPKNIGINQIGLHKAIKYNIQKMNSELHHDLYQNIHVCGGNF